MEHKVVIFRHDKEYKIVGGQLAVKKGDVVQFYNSAGYPADIQGDTEDSLIGKFQLEDGNMHPITMETEGWYPYTVTVAAIEDQEEHSYEAQASKPIVIVYP